MLRTDTYNKKNAAMEQQNEETTQQATGAQQENIKIEKEEGPGLKREIRRPSYLKDFVSR